MAGGATGAATPQKQALLGQAGSQDKDGVLAEEGGLLEGQCGQEGRRQYEPGAAYAPSAALMPFISMPKNAHSQASISMCSWRAVGTAAVLHGLCRCNPANASQEFQPVSSTCRRDLRDTCGPKFAGWEPMALPVACQRHSMPFSGQLCKTQRLNVAPPSRRWRGIHEGT
eukprot:1161394-Pelagomonas_calceolata.AAC.7